MDIWCILLFVSYEKRTSCYMFKKYAMKGPFKSERWNVMRLKRPQVDVLKRFLSLDSFIFIRSHANTFVSSDRYQEAPTISNMLLSFSNTFQHKNSFFVVTDTNTFKPVSLLTKNRMTGQTKETYLYFMEPMESI